RPARRDSGAAAHILPGPWRRIRARTKNARRHAAAPTAPAPPNRYGNPDRVRSSDSHGGGAICLVLPPAPRIKNGAARLPDRIAPSMVAGKPVLVQSPATTRLRHAVRASGRFSSCAVVAAKVARRSRTTCHAGGSFGNGADTTAHAAATSDH